MVVFHPYNMCCPNEEEEREGANAKKLSQRMNVRRSFLIFGGVGGNRGLS